MNKVYITAPIELDYIAESLDQDSAMKLILAADLAMADYQFTFDLIISLIKSLQKNDPETLEQIIDELKKDEAKQ